MFLKIFQKGKRTDYFNGIEYQIIKRKTIGLFLMKLPRNFPKQGLLPYNQRKFNLGNTLRPLLTFVVVLLGPFPKSNNTRIIRFDLSLATTFYLLPHIF